MIAMSIESVETGMRVGKPVFSEDGRMLVGRGLILNDYFIKSLIARGISQIYILDPDTDDIIPRDNISEVVRGATIRDLKQLFGDLQDTISKEVKTESMDAITDAINSDQFIKTFGNNPAFQKLTSDADRIVDELIQGELTLGLNSLKTYDNYTFQHSIDVAIVSIMIGRKLGLPTKRLRELGIGGLLHDMGKIFMPTNIVNKPDKLTEEEFDVMKMHPDIGYELVKGVASIGILPPHVAFQHHERQDGSGYPRGLTGNNRVIISKEPRTIHLYGSISAVADVYDALSSDRPYRKAMPPEKVITIMKEMNATHLNKDVLRYFFSITPVFPVGTIVMVKNGEYRNFLGIVCNVNEGNLERPVIRLVFNPTRQRIKPFDINLVEQQEIEIESKIL